LKKNNLLIRGIFILAFFLVVFSSCGDFSQKQPKRSVENLSYRNIPGVTPDEITAIETLKTQYGSFSCAINLNTDSFYDKNGELSGYTILFYKWLSNFFGIPFKPEINEWGSLLKKIESREIDFTIELAETPERRASLFLTRPIAQRPFKLYRIAGSEPLETIIHVRHPRYAFLTNSVLVYDAKANIGYNFDTVFVGSHADAYPLLENGEVDAYIALDNTESVFDKFGNVVGEDFFPLIFRSFSLLTGNAELKPIITVLDKALDTHTLAYLAGLRKAGYQKYLETKLYRLLTEEERSYIKDHPVVPIAAEFNNYPVSFFDVEASRWQGIYFNALDEIATMTGITFECVNKPRAQYAELVAMLENGTAQIMSELYRIQDYENRFLWSEVSLLQDNYAFITRSDFHNIDVSEVSYLRVSSRKHSHYSELFKKMFPGNQNFIEYDTQEETWDKLKNGDIDAVFSSRRRLVIYTNYHEEAGFKLNLLFDNEFDTSFGFNKDAVVLRSIIDKSLNLISINNISNQWMNRSYDYRIKLTAARFPWLIGMSVLFFFIILLVSILLRKSRNVGRRLEDLVKQRTSALAFETSKLQAVFDSIPDILFCKDTNYKYTQCNASFEHYLGVKEAEIVGKSDRDGAWFHPDDMQIIHDNEETVISENRVLIFEEKIHSPNTGKESYFETVKAPIRQDGVVVGIVAIVHDIGQRKKLEEEIAFKSDKLQMIVDTIPDILFCKDTNLKYTQCNKPFENFWGIPEADMLGKADGDSAWFSPDMLEKIDKTELSVMENGKSIIHELNLFAPLTGKKAVFESVISPLRQNGKVVGILCVARDITTRKAMEDEIRAALESKTSFLAHMSHELRTPLNVVIGLTDLILEDAHLDVYVTNNVLKINNAGSTLLSIVNSILDFSKIESGKLEIIPVEYFTASLLNDVTTVVITRLGEKPIKFHLDIENDMPERLRGDDLRVKQIVINLLTNAIKYTREGSIELSIRCTREAYTVWLDIAVSDTGIGIRENDLKKLFNDYVQVDTSTNHNIEGTGLGLPITKKLVELMKGEIKAESEYGKGTTFRVRLGQGFVDNAILGPEIVNKLSSFQYAEDKRIANKKILRLDLSYARVLVVDDVLTNLDVAAGLLRKYRMQVDCLDNGPAAIERIRNGTPVYNAIFMDHMMPDMDGIEAVDHIRALGTEYAKKIPIIALTANAIHGTEQLFYEHDFQAFISKPIDMVELDLVIRKWVRDDTRDDVPVLNAPVYNDLSAPITIEIPGVDTKKGLALYAGDTGVYLTLLRSYVTNTPGLLDKLRIVTENTLPKYNVTVHGLKGSSAGIGAESIRESAFELEKISKEGNLQGVWALNGKLIADTKIIVANIKAWLEQYDASREKKPVKKAPDKELLKQLRQNCEKYDIKGVDKILTVLESADYEKDGDLIKWVRDKIENSDFSEAAEKLKEYE